MFPDVTYEEFSIATQPGDAIVFVSDGILDAENEKEEMYGEDRLAGLLCASRDLSAQEIADAILADVSRFQGSKDRFDDETIIVLRVRESDALPQTSKDPS
jgi:sigma-B regulation protein RsbU (phosphoserine phosphatase)